MTISGGHNKIDMIDFTPDEVRSVVLNARKLRAADLMLAPLWEADLRGADRYVLARERPS